MTTLRADATTASKWPIISKATAAFLGGYIVTYFAGAAFAKAMVAFKVLDKVDAGLAAGLVQLVTYTGIIIWAAAMTSVKKTWLSLAALTAVCAAVIYFTRIP